MMRWEPTDPTRLQPQEMALLNLCDRMTVLEQAQTLELETQRQLILEQARRLSKQHDLIVENREAIRLLEDRLRRLEARVRSFE